jgi:hypothetical protein
MRTQEEIAKRIKELDADPTTPFGFAQSALLECLDFEHARPFLKKDTTAEEWGEPAATTRELLLDAMRDYMPFAWGKAEDHRGLSAMRSIEKFESWVWALGEDELLAAVKAAPYENYGAPKLAAVCRALGFPVPSGERVQRMIDGQRCGADYECGCSEAIVGEGAVKYVGGSGG